MNIVMPNWCENCGEDYIRVKQFNFIYCDECDKYSAFFDVRRKNPHGEGWVHGGDISFNTDTLTTAHECRICNVRTCPDSPTYFLCDKCEGYVFDRGLKLGVTSCEIKGCPRHDKISPKLGQGVRDLISWPISTVFWTTLEVIAVAYDIVSTLTKPFRKTSSKSDDTQSPIDIPHSKPPCKEITEPIQNKKGEESTQSQKKKSRRPNWMEHWDGWKGGPLHIAMSRFRPSNWYDPIPPAPANITPERNRKKIIFDVLFAMLIFASALCVYFLLWR